jgi:hypothetical protein
MAWDARARLDNAQPWSTIPLGIGRHTPFATQVAALLNYATGRAARPGAPYPGRHRQRGGNPDGASCIDRNRAFTFLTRTSQNRNIKVRDLAQQIIDGPFERTSREDIEFAAVL